MSGSSSIPNSKILSSGFRLRSSISSEVWFPLLKQSVSTASQGDAAISLCTASVSPLIPTTLISLRFRKSRASVSRSKRFSARRNTLTSGDTGQFCICPIVFLGAFSLLCGRSVWVRNRKKYRDGPSEQSLNIVRSNVNQYQELYQKEYS